MARCPFCRDDIKDWDMKRKGYLIGTQDIDNHTHIHATFDKPEALKEIIKFAIVEADLQQEFESTTSLKEPPKEVVFRNKQRIGDSLMFTCGVRDLKKSFPQIRVNVISTAMHIWDNNPNVDFDLEPTEANTVFIGPKDLTNASNRLDWHFCNAYRVSIEKNLGIKIDQGPTKPDIWLTEEEYNDPPVTKDPYWIISIGGEKGWGCKMYPFNKWQEVVDLNPDILFYQIGAKEDKHPRLKGSNVVDYIGKTQDKETGIRDLFKLFLNMEGGIGLVSFGMHLASAFNKPYVVIAGAREPRSFTAYPGHQYLSTENTMPCAPKACWHCDIDTCSQLVRYDNAEVEHDRKVPLCVDIISPQDISNAINKYYLGGILKKGVQFKKPDRKHLNIAKEHRPYKPMSVISLNQEPKTMIDEIPLGGSNITKEDWIFIEEALLKYGVENVLEFGANASTLLFTKMGLKVICYESDIDQLEKIKMSCPNASIREWDGKEIKEELKHFDFAFVDGPSGGANREFSTKIASEHSDMVIIHDGGRTHEKKWQEMYLKEGFEGPMKGGHRCHLWIKKGFVVEEEKEVKCNITPEGKKFIKFISTARGWGGCARSCTTIMKYLLKEGHRVEFIPFRNSVSSREYKECFRTFLRDVTVTESYDTVSEHCDVLFIYADDYCWEFGTPLMTETFSNINAERKIMMLNYRRSRIGEIEWTRNFDKYMFLNSEQERELLKFLPEAKTKVLPPCTELSPFLSYVPNYQDGIRIVRHSSQRDTKYRGKLDDHSFIDDLETILNSRKDINISKKDNYN